MNSATTGGCSCYRYVAAVATLVVVVAMLAVAIDEEAVWDSKRATLSLTMKNNSRNVFASTRKNRTISGSPIITNTFNDDKNIGSISSTTKLGGNLSNDTRYRGRDDQTKLNMTIVEAEEVSPAGLVANQVTKTQENTVNTSLIRKNDAHTKIPTLGRRPASNWTAVRTDGMTGIQRKYLDRGSNFWFADSGCYVSVWVFNAGPRLFRDCREVAHSRSIEGRSHLVQANDTIYVPFKFIPSFLDGPLQNITVPVVVISGQYLSHPPDRINKFVIRRFLQHPSLMKWIVQNPNMYLNGGTFRGPRFKVASLPFGLQRYHYTPNNPNPPPAVSFREAFQRHLQLPEKTRDIFYGYISTFTSAKRGAIPSGAKLPLHQFYDELAKSRFVVSPAGDRPDCYRNLEALAFGAIPITDLDPFWYPFFQEGPVIYSTTEWNNLTEANLLNRMQVEDFPVTNRNMVFEEYWQEYMDRVTGMPLRWWDQIGLRTAFLTDFVNYTVG